MGANLKLKLIAWGFGIWILGGMGTFPFDSREAHGSWQKIEEGLELTAHQIEGPPYETLIRFIGLRINPKKFQLRVMESRAWGVDRMDIKSLVRKNQALAGINGGFFQPDFKPLGLIIVDGRQTNPIRKTDWGIFLIENERARIIHTRDFQNDRMITQALQVGPRLVAEGRELRLKRQVARRSALGITSDGDVILLNTEDTEVYAQDLARIFRLPEVEGGLGCREALALDGGPSAQMYGEYKNLRIDIPGKTAVANGIGVFPMKERR
jgi:uncharacterized protein YigE (DUF2233 family)